MCVLLLERIEVTGNIICLLCMCSLEKFYNLKAHNHSRATQISDVTNKWQKGKTKLGALTSILDIYIYIFSNPCQ